jgi:hypothetical protein
MYYGNAVYKLLSSAIKELKILHMKIHLFCSVKLSLHWNKPNLNISGSIELRITLKYFQHPNKSDKNFTFIFPWSW